MNKSSSFDAKKVVIFNTSNVNSYDMFIKTVLHNVLKYIKIKVSNNVLIITIRDKVIILVTYWTSRLD